MTRADPSFPALDDVWTIAREAYLAGSTADIPHRMEEGRVVLTE